MLYSDALMGRPFPTDGFWDKPWMAGLPVSGLWLMQEWGTQLRGAEALSLLQSRVHMCSSGSQQALGLEESQGSSLSPSWSTYRTSSWVTPSGPTALGCSLLVWGALLPPAQKLEKSFPFPHVNTASHIHQADSFSQKPLAFLLSFFWKHSDLWKQPVVSRSRTGPC